MCVRVCVVITWQRLVAGQFPLQSDRLRSAVNPAPEAGRLAHAHCSTVGLDGDDGALETCGTKQSSSVIRYDVVSLRLRRFIYSVSHHKENRLHSGAATLQKLKIHTIFVLFLAHSNLITLKIGTCFQTIFT